MSKTKFSSSHTCRICLQYDAKYPIFKESTTKTSVYSELIKCFMEKIEDVEGYPRSICSNCKIKLNMFSEFIDEYRKSSEILKDSLVRVKMEVDDNLIMEMYNDDYLMDNQVFIQLENDTGKTKNICDSKEIIEKLKPLPGLKITKVEPGRSLERKQSSTKKAKPKNSNTASGIIDSESQLNKNEGGITKSSKYKIKIKARIDSNVAKLVEIEEKSFKVTSQNSSILCDYCGAVFNSMHTLKCHVENSHTNIPAICKICSRKYPSDKLLILHTKRCHTEKKLQCEQCPTMFSTKGQLGCHIKRVHNKHLFPRIFPCKFCNKTFKSYYTYIAHERATHTGLRPAVCNVCGKAFYHNIYLKEHMRIHTRELPYKCPFCDRGCTIRSNLKSHLRTHKKSELTNEILSKMKPIYFKFLKDC